MITFLLLVIIYLAFISLGLPDSLLGVALPAIQEQWGIPMSFGGVISIIGIAGTVTSSFFSSIIIDKWGTGKVTLLSCLITASALLGISLSPSVYWILLLAFPLGIGAGAVDAALNNYVALHFKAHHMNWLHSFWGIGATLGPVIMSLRLEMTGGWQLGYRTIALIQFSLASVLLFSLGLWKKHRAIRSNGEEEKSASRDSTPGDGAVDNHARKLLKEGYFSVLKLKGVNYALFTMMLYCALEFSVGLWGANFLVQVKNFAKDDAARWIALYYGGITAGRMLSGFVSFKLNNVKMIRLGSLMALAGVAAIMLPLPSWLMGAAFIFTGLGLAPIFPAMLHETPERFSKDASQRIMGFQMGFGYIGGAILPPLMGLTLQKLGVHLFPYILVAWALLMLYTSEALNWRILRNQR